MTTFRSATEDDMRFVVASWASSYKSAHAAGMIASEDWPSVMHPQIRKLLGRPGARTIVACDAPRFLYGFIAGDTTGEVPVVFYVYVKAPFRSQPGLGPDRLGPRYARQLFAALGVDPARPFLYACETPVAKRLASKIPRARFVPAAARYTNYQQEQHDHER